MANLVVHFEIHASEPQRLVDFYTSLFDWRFTQFGDYPYWMIETGEEAIGNVDARPGLGINGGLTQREGPAPTADAPVKGCNIVVGVDDADAIFARAVELGAIEAVPLEDTEGVGRTASLIDPDGNVFGIISPVMSDGTRAM
ncbi:VOC family protein [Agromyces sp. NPDC058136]|uniref:VOC family protein n=1 Tax=Agromyces sp. NPDC058136 TaxID=3346354 RepID=UPI0036DF8066